MNVDLNLNNLPSAKPGPKLEIRQTQSLLMTTQLRQAISLLQMSNLELGELVEKELEANPFLDREEDKLASFEDSEKTIDNYDAPTPAPEEDLSAELNNADQFDDYGSDCEGYEYRDYYTSKPTDDEFDFFEQRLSAEKSFHVFLSEQISLKFTSQKDKFIALSLSEFLDESGYFRGNCADIAQKLNQPETYVKNMLQQMKGFEPSGIFAETLADCLKIQLQDQNRFDPAIEKLLQNLELLANRDYKALKKICQVEEEDLLDMIKDIKALNPKPLANFSAAKNPCIIPDIFVKTNKAGDYRVELNPQTLPKVLINQEYCTEVKKLGNKEAGRYLKTQLGNASFLIKSLHQRAASILKVSEEIIKSQKEFLEKGIDFLRPMQLKDIAEAVEMHESSISRITTNKYLHTPRGLFELKYFFSNSAGTYNGVENISTLSIKHKIKKLIEEENADNILSDDKLVEELAKQSIKIARRTVTKYRENLNILSSSARKRLKKNLLAA